MRFLAPEHVRLTREALRRKTSWRDNVPRYLDGIKKLRERRRLQLCYWAVIIVVFAAHGIGVTLTSALVFRAIHFGEELETKLN